MERIGIFGGTFDPIHNGHLSAALQAYEQLQLDKILFVVAGQPWQKISPHGPQARWLLTSAAVGSLSWAEVCDIEIEREGPTYTIDTLRELHDPDNQELFLLVGSDQYQRLQTWKDVDELPKYATIHWMQRWLNLSSTQIRARIKGGLPIDFLVPEQVAILIAMFGLYKESGATP